ncbi:hypothetical protein HDU76_001417, partial [Blyttiomyces sp. JEL0837]
LLALGITISTALPSGNNADRHLKRHLSDPGCAVCSYHNNIEHKFYAIAYSNGTLVESVEEFIDFAGPGWAGHRLCCDHDPPSDTHNITNAFGHVREIKLSTEKPVVQERLTPGLNVTSSKRRDSTVPVATFIQQPPVCVPLLSTHPLFNPYNPALTPADSATRPLLAFPLYVNKSITCPDSSVNTQPCTINIQETITTTTSLSYSVTDGSSNSYTNSIGTTASVGQTSDVMQSVTDSLEKSNTFTHTNSNGGSNSQTWSQALTKTSESQTNWQRTHSTDQQTSLSVGHDTNSQQSHAQESGTSSSDEEGWNTSATASATVTAEEDFGIGKASESATVSGTVGASGSHTDGSQQSNIDTNKGQTNETSLALGVGISASINPGVTVDVVYLTQALFTQVPFLCKQNGQDVIITADMADLSKSTSNSKSLTVIAPNQPPNYYQFNDNYLKQATAANSITSDSVVTVNQQTTAGTDITGSKLMVMSSTSYEVWLSGYGELYVKKKDAGGKVGAKVWQTHTNVQRTTDQVVNNVLYNKGSSRLLIDDFGHILVQVGMKKAGYTFILEEFPAAANQVTNWNLILYDGGGSKVWCATSAQCNWAGSTGYRFPRNYLLPTDFPTNAVDPFADTSAYPHNWLNPAYTFTVANSSVHISENQKCGPLLVSGQGLTSPNGRFKLILDFSGNLIFKDGVRTMWETYTANVDFAVPPYSLALSNRGSLYVSDKFGGLIVNTLLENSIVRNSYITISDQGELQVHGTDGRPIWTSFDQINPAMSGFRGWTGRKAFCYAACRTCIPKQPTPLSMLLSNGSDYTPWTAYLTAGQTLLPTVGNVSLSVTNTSVTIGNCTLFQGNQSQVIAGMILTISGTGRLSYIDVNATQAAWQVGTFFTGIEPFAVTVENSTLTIRDSNNTVTYSKFCAPPPPPSPPLPTNCGALNGFPASANVTNCPFAAPSNATKFKPTNPLYISALSDVTVSVEINGGSAGNAGAYVYHFSGSNDFTTNYFGNGTFTLARGTNNDCLGVNVTSSVVMKTKCNAVSSGVLWWTYITPSGETMYVNGDATAASGPVGMCLSFTSLVDNAVPVVQSCNVSNSAQKFQNVHVPTSYTTLFNMDNGKCMTVATNNTIQLFSCSAPTNQQIWNYGTDGTFRPKSNPTFCLDVNGALQNSSPLTIKACSGAKSQSWTYDQVWLTFSNNAAPSFGIKNYNRQSTDGNAIQLYTLDKTISCTWQYGGNYVAINSGTFNYIFDSAKNNLAVEGGTDGTVKLQSWTSGSNAQQFKADNGLLRWRFNEAMCLHTGAAHSAGYDLIIDSCIRNGAVHTTTWSFSGKNIKANGNGQCMNDYGANHNAGDQIATWACDTSSSNSWTWSTTQPTYVHSSLVSNGYNRLQQGESLVSPSGNTKIYFDSNDGTVYIVYNGNTEFFPNSGGHSGYAHPFYIEMQNDANFVLYDNNRTPLWSIGQGGQASGVYRADLGDDGKLRFYNSNGDNYYTLFYQ